MERPSHSDLQAQMERLADGDRSAFHPVYESLWPIVRRFAARHLPADEAEDAAQEALLKIFHRSATFDPERSAVAWALAIAAFEIRTIRRRRQRRRESPPDADGAPAVDPSPSPEETAMQRDLQEAVRVALGELRPGDAETLRLYSQGDRAQIAAATFRKRVGRALGRLRAVWRTTDERP